MTTTGLRPRLNVRQRKDTGYLPHSSPFSLQFRPAILYSDGYLPLVPEDKNETDKIHTPRIVPQNWSARHLTPVALAVATVLCWLAVKRVMKQCLSIKMLTTVQLQTRAKAPNVPPRTTMR